jgi:hypothetical protein
MVNVDTLTSPCHPGGTAGLRLAAALDPSLTVRMSPTNVGVLSPNFSRILIYRCVFEDGTTT